MNYIIIAVAAIAIILVFYFISVGNRLERQRVKIQEAESGIDVALTKRFDTLTKMFDVAKQYMKHEQEVLIETIKLRKGMSLDEKMDANQKMDEISKQISIVAEAYPVLGSQTLFVELQKGIADTEEHLQAARRLYNANVSGLNQMVVSFPSGTIAGMKGISQQPMFEADASKREDVKF